MSRFSEKVREIVKNSGDTIYQISKQSGMGRTSLHKIMSGELVPGVEFMEKFYRYFCLLPSEKEELKYLYMIERVGPVHYENRMYIRQILEELANYYTSSSKVQIDYKVNEKSSQQQSGGFFRCVGHDWSCIKRGMAKQRYARHLYEYPFEIKGIIGVHLSFFEGV